MENTITVKPVRTKKQKLRAALAYVRKQYMDSIAEAIVNETEKGYEQIAREHGVSRQFVIDTAAQRNVGRNRLTAEDMDEVTNG